MESLTDTKLQGYLMTQTLKQYSFRGAVMLALTLYRYDAVTSLG